MSPVNFDGNNYLVFLHASHMPFYGSTPSVSPLSFAAHSIYSPVHVPVPNSSIPRRSPLPPPLSTFPGHGYPRPCALHVRSHPAFYLFFVHSAPPFPLLSCFWLFFRSPAPLAMPAHPYCVPLLCVCSPSFPISECYHLLVSFLESWGIAGTTCTGSSARFMLISCCEEKDGFKTCEYSASNTNQIAIQENKRSNIQIISWNHAPRIPSYSRPHRG